MLHSRLLKKLPFSVVYSEQSLYMIMLWLQAWHVTTVSATKKYSYPCYFNHGTRWLILLQPLCYSRCFFHRNIFCSYFNHIVFLPFLLQPQYLLTTINSNTVYCYCCYFNHSISLLKYFNHSSHYYYYSYFNYSKIWNIIIW